MKTKRNYHLGQFLACAFLLLLTSNAPVLAIPELGTHCTVFKPAVLKQYTVKESELIALTTPGKKKKEPTYGQDGANTNEPWYVYSDRSNNTAYESPSLSSSKCGSLDFNEEVIIARIENGFALVYTEPGVPQYPQISRKAKCKGWVPMNHLLLWSSCPANEKGIYNKAIIVGNIDKLKVDNATVGFYYKNPVTKDGKENLRSLMKFYFVMKKDPETGMHLLANYSKIGATKNELFGWVSEGMYSPWSQRTCVESNWKKDALDVLRGQKVPIGTVEYLDPKKKTGASINKVTEIVMGEKKNNVTNSEALAFRWMPRTLRYPILENIASQDMFKVTAFASIGGRDASIDDFGASIDKIQKALDNMRNINLIFVVDGTKGMERYFKTVQTAINRASGSDYFGKEDRTIKVGLVIYRDRADGKYVTEHLSMRKPTDSKLAEWLKNGGEYGINNDPNDHSDYEALYEGLNVALDAGKMGYSRTQSNLMFVIGDCGNEPNDKSGLSQDDIIKKCIENRIQLSSFNVRNIDTGPYQQFRKQMSRIVMKNMEGQYSQLGIDIKPWWEQNKDGYDFKHNNPETTLFIGSFRNAESGKDMEEKQLYNLVYSTSQKVNEAIKRQEDILMKVMNSSGNSVKGDNEAASITEKYLTSIGLGKDIKALQGFRLAFEGYTPKRNEDGIDYWLPVIYISHSELLKLLEELKKVNDEVDKQSDDRHAYVEAMKALAASMTGESEEEIMKMRDKDIMNMVTGLNVRTNALNYRLIDIESKKLVTPQQYKELTTRFVEQYNKLDAIRHNNYPFSFREENASKQNKNRSGETWYWIPAEDLP